MTIFLMIVAAIAGYLARIVHEWNIDECPRVIRGYNCKGEDCDHSARAVAEAKWDMYRS